MKKRSTKNTSKCIVGWREWCHLPDLGVPAILAKLDTGAKTSCLHAFEIEPFSRGKEHWVRFIVHPVQRHRRPELQCEAPLVDERPVTSSNGSVEHRYVIQTPMVLGTSKFPTQITLTNRDEMGFRLLIGRKAMRRRLIVDPETSFRLGRPINTPSKRSVREHRANAVRTDQGEEE